MHSHGHSEQDARVERDGTVVAPGLHPPLSVFASLRCVDADELLERGLHVGHLHRRTVGDVVAIREARAHFEHVHGISRDLARIVGHRLRVAK